MKTIRLKVASITCSLALLAACTPSSDNTSSLAELNRALDVASNTMNSFEQKNTGTDGAVNKDNVMDVFSKDYAENLNKDQPLAHLGPLGVKAEADGSFSAYSDKNKNNTQDAGEKDVFKLEVDAQNDRLLASNEEAVQEQPQMGMGTGLLMGMLLGNMMSRQRMTGANPASKKATPRTRTAAPKKSNTMRSRAGSGSHASGK